MKTKKVKDVMTSPAIMCEQDTPIKEVIQIMKNKNIGFIPITTNNIITGVITDRDILMNYLSLENSNQPIKTIVLNTEIHYVNPETPLIDAAKIMAKNKIRRLVVINDGNVVGVLTSKNICFEKNLIPYIIETYVKESTLKEYLMYANSNPHDSLKTSDYPL